MTDTVTLTRAEYEALLERLEEAEDVAAYDRHRDGDTMPFEITARIVRGENPVTVWREHRGMSQMALADTAGISASMLNEVEHGKRQPSLDKARALAKALNADLDDLFGGN